MGISASSLLDETKSNFIKGQAENELKAFSPYFRKQFSVARFSQAEDDLEQQKEKITQLLRQREAPQEAEVLYEEAVLYFDDTRKWRERYIVVRANYCLECHESLETFVKGVPPRHKLLPTGGTVLVTEEKYMEMVDKCFPDDTNVKEDFTPPLSGMPGQFPVYLRLPYRRDSYFCFKQAAKQDAFISILSDCIRHQNQDFLKKKTCEVQAFLKAIQLYRQDKDKYEAWDMLIGSDVRVLANVVMEQLLPSLERDMLPRLKAKKTEKKRVWFATVEAAYILVQEHLLQGLSALKDECRASVRQQEVVMHSDMDQIVSCRRQLEEKVRDKVSEAAEKLCSERVQPYLGSILDELMEPISSGFQDGRELSDNMMDQVCRDVAAGRQNEELKEALAATLRPNLSSCYMKIGSLQQKLQNLQQRFGFSNMSGIVHSAQIDLQQLTQNAAHTFEQLLLKAMKDNPDGACAAIEKAKHRVLKQYDYDSSTVRKRIFQEALVSITLPFIKKNLAPTCKAEVQSLEQFIYADHSNFIHVENVYESVLLQTLDKEVTKVVKEAASLKKYNLFTDRDLVSQSSRSSLSSPTTSTPGSPAMALASPPKVQSEPQPPSPLVVNGLPSSPKSEDLQDKEDSAPPGNTSVDVTVMETPLGKVELKETVAAELTVAAETTVAIEMTVTQSKAGTEKSETPKPDEVQVAAEAAVALETAAFPNTSASDETQEGKAAAPEIQVQEQPISETETMPTAAEPSAEAPQEAETVLIPSTDDSLTETEAAAAETVPCDPLCPSSELSSEVPSSDQVSVVTLADDELQEEGDKAEPLTISDPNSLDVSVGSESPPSDIESTEDVRAVQSSKDEVSMTSEVLKDEANRSKSPESSDDAPEDKGVTEETSNPQTQMEAASEDAGTSEDVGASEDVGVSCEAATSITVEASAEVTTSTSSQPAQDEARPPDCIKDIRDLVEEVIEVEELVQRYPSGVPKDE